MYISIADALHCSEKDGLAAQCSKVVGSLINFWISSQVVNPWPHARHTSPIGPKVEAVKSLGDKSRNLADPSKKREHRVKRRLCLCTWRKEAQNGGKYRASRALLSHSYRHHKRGVGKARQGESWGGGQGIIISWSWIMYRVRPQNGPHEMERN